MVSVASEREASGFGVSLRSLRRSRGLTQGQLGDLLGVTAQAVAKYESGLAEPTWPVVLRLATALGVTPDAFLQAPPPPDESPQDRPTGKRK